MTTNDSTDLSFASLDRNKNYSAEDAAKLLRVKEQTITDYCRDGRLKGKKIGPKKRWHVKGSEILRLAREWGLDGT